MLSWRIKYLIENIKYETLFTAVNNLVSHEFAMAVFQENYTETEVTPIDTDGRNF